jgi:hypothetical protein
MLTVTIHAGEPAAACEANSLGWLQIAQKQRGAIVDFKTLMFVRGLGALEQALVPEYARWSGSLLDLVARSIAVSVERVETLPAPPLERGCAYARRMCVLVEHQGMHGPRVRPRLATLDIEMTKRGIYQVQADEDILGTRTAEGLVYRPVRLNAWLLAAYACTAVLHGAPALPPRPALKLPPTVKAEDGTACVEVAALPEPMRTGLQRWLIAKGQDACPALVPEHTLADFLQVAI